MFDAVGLLASSLPWINRASTFRADPKLRTLSFIRVAVGRSAVLVAASAVFVRRVGVFLAPVMSSMFMMVGSLTVVMGRRFVMRCRIVVVFAGWMFRCSH